MGCLIYIYRSENVQLHVPKLLKQINFKNTVTFQRNLILKIVHLFSHNVTKRHSRSISSFNFKKTPKKPVIIN